MDVTEDESITMAWIGQNSRQYGRRSLPRQLSTIINQHEYDFDAKTPTNAKHKKSKSLDPKLLDLYIRRTMIKDGVENIKKHQKTTDKLMAKLKV